MFGKVENGILYNAPSTITKDGMVHYHPNAKLYKEFGYFKVEATPCPETDTEQPKYYAYKWLKKNGKIVKVWYETEPPLAEIQKPTIQEQIAELNSRISLNEQSITDTQLSLIKKGKFSIDDVSDILRSKISALLGGDK